MKRKVRIVATPGMAKADGLQKFMQAGGPSSPVTQDMRNQWNVQQGNATRQGFQGDNHSRVPGQQFMQSQGTDPGQLANYQQDLLNQSKITPWGNVPAATASTGKFSGVDNHYGTNTRGESYTEYQVQHNNEAPVSFGNNWQAATTYNNNLANRGNGSQSSQSTTTDSDMGFPLHDWNTNGENSEQRALNGANQPSSGFGHSSMAPGTQQQPSAGLAATGFPTREEAIAKYKGNQNSAPIADNTHTDEDTDYSIDSVRASAKYGGIQKRKVRISQVPHTPTSQIPENDLSPQMGMGGSTYIPGGSGTYGNQQSGHGYALDRFWSSPAGYPGATSKVNPFAKVGTSLPEAQDGGDINAEKQERVLGDFDQDGQLELMNVNGPSHADGGKDVDVPSHSFVFSDTKDLKIKDPSVLALFSMPAKRGGYTPADIAKKYDLNKYKKVTDNPDSDEMSLKTAQLMTDSYLAKLNRLAELQEGMKKNMGMDHHDPNQPQMSRNGGPVPCYQYGSVFPAEEHDIPQRPTMDANGRPLVASSDVPPVGMGIGPTINAGGIGRQPLTADDYDQMFKTALTQAKSNPKFKKGKDYGSDWVSPTLAEPLMRAKGYTGPIDVGQYNQWIHGDNQAYNTVGEGVNPNAFGVRDARYLPPMPLEQEQQLTINPKPVDSPDTPPPGTIPPPYVSKPNMPDVPGAGKEKSGNGRQWGFGVDPNFLGNVQNALQIANLRKFVPYEPAPQAVIPDTVFLDPTRAIAAQQEEARSGSEMDVMSGNPQAARAMALARQGVAGKQAADVVGQYHNQNVGIANTAADRAANITNDLMAKQANRLAELNKGNFLSDRDYQRELATLQKEGLYRTQQEHNANVNRSAYNAANPYFYRDQQGYSHLKPGVTQAKLEELYGSHNGNNAPTGTGSSAQYAKAQSRYEELMKYGMFNDGTEGGKARARAIAAKEAGLDAYENTTYKGTSMIPGSREFKQQGINDDPYSPTGPSYRRGGLMELGGHVDLYKRSQLKKFIR